MLPATYRSENLGSPGLFGEVQHLAPWRENLSGAHWVSGATVLPSFVYVSRWLGSKKRPTRSLGYGGWNLGGSAFGPEIHLAGKACRQGAMGRTKYIREQGRNGGQMPSGAVAFRGAGITAETQFGNQIRPSAFI